LKKKLKLNNKKKSQKEKDISLKGVLSIKLNGSKVYNTVSIMTFKNIMITTIINHYYPDRNNNTMIQKKFSKLIGLKYEDFLAYVESGQIIAQESRLISFT